MDALQITYKLKKGRRTLVAVVGRGSHRVELGTGLKLPTGVEFNLPRNVVGGDHRDRNTYVASLNAWEAAIRDRWGSLLQKSPASVPADLLRIKEPAQEVQKEKTCKLTLLVWINHLADQIMADILCNDRTGRFLSKKTIEFNKYFINVMTGFVGRHGDFDFGVNATHEDFQRVGSKIKRYLLEEMNYGQETTFKLMERVRWLIRSRIKGLRVSIDAQMLASFRYPRPRKNSSDDIVALDIDQYQWVIRNEAVLRADFPKPNQQVAIDYLVVGLITCARKGDMDSWTATNLRAIGQETGLRYVPAKTKSSSGVLVDITPVPECVAEIFKRNLNTHGKLMPPLSAGLGRAIRGILRKQPIFHREVTVRLASGSYTKKKTWEALRVHALRSSGITYLLSQGIPDGIVRSISGHTGNSDSFAVYSKVLDRVKRNTLQEVYSRF
jgi:hypothetical protein